VSDERAAWIALGLAPGIGYHRMAAIVAAAGSASGAWSAPLELLGSAAGLSAAATAAAIRSTSPGDGRRLIEQVGELGGTVLLPWDGAYPAALRDIEQPPPFLCALGKLEHLALPAVAVVGSRDHTPYGARACRDLARTAAASGLAVVSGLARGLDAVAHQAALDAGGATIGVLGNGLGVVYPAANRHLYQRMARDGLILSEFPPGERPRAGWFPRRNRLVSGLAKVSVVVEAALKSGALVTAAAALEQGREVMALPGPIDSPTSAGANRLIRDGAAPYLEPRDLFAHYPGIEPAPIAPARPASGRSADPLCAALADGPLPLDVLTGRSGLGASGALARLTALELEGVLVRRPDGLFALVPDCTGAAAVG
jgi:DNA processing protein